MSLMSIKSKIKHYLISITDNVAKSERQITNKAILITRLDAIGDYILFRNFLEILRKEYKDYHITLVGNISWKEIAEEFDKKFIDSFIWINRNKFERNIFYRYKKLREITQQGYELVINPTFSRTFYVDDAIVALIKAKEKIGSVGDLSNIKLWQKNISDKYYTKLIPAKRKIMFEFYRNKEFFENLLSKKIDIQKPSIKLKKQYLRLALPQKFAVLFIGASASFRKWDIKNFVEVGEFLRNKYKYNIVLAGGKNDAKDAQIFESLASYNFINLVGKTNLLELIDLISRTSLIVSNETSVPHIAVALNKGNIFVISNGNHLCRFTPYPEKIWPYYYPIYHPKIENYLKDFKELCIKYGVGSSLNINDIAPEQVKNKIEKVLG